MVYVSGQENDLDSPLKAQVNSLRSPSLRSPSPTLRLLERSQELRRGCRDTMRVGSSKERELPPSPVHLHPRRSLCDPGPSPGPLWALSLPLGGGATPALQSPGLWMRQAWCVLTPPHCLPAAPGRVGGLAHPGEGSGLAAREGPQPQAGKDVGRQNAGGRQSRGQRWRN